jgi:hypothetical protein
MPLFHDIVVRQARPAISARSVRDAYLITLNERGALDFGRMAELLGAGGSQNENAVRDALAGEGLIFDDPDVTLHAIWRSSGRLFDVVRAGRVVFVSWCHERARAGDSQPTVTPALSLPAT